MLKLIKLEYLKLKHNRAMWWLLGLYILAVILISFSGGFILQMLANNGVEYKGIDPTVIPIYAFDDIWQNLTYLGYFFKIFPAFLIIISICNEFSYKTHRQNIIDGLSRTEFFLSKTTFAAFLAVLSGVLMLILGLILGGLNSSVGGDLIFTNIEFIPAHILQLLLYFLFAMFLAMLIRKTGVTIVLLLLYSLILEPIGAAIIQYNFGQFYGNLFPLESISTIVSFPFARYAFVETQNYVAIKELLIACGWGAVFTFFIFRILKKRDF
jgi:ABC-type transport system involved in multi-copper enzyme maturation permease subunit